VVDLFVYLKGEDTNMARNLQDIILRDSDLETLRGQFEAEHGYPLEHLHSNDNPSGYYRDCSSLANLLFRLFIDGEPFPCNLLELKLMLKVAGSFYYDNGPTIYQELLDTIEADPEDLPMIATQVEDDDEGIWKSVEINYFFGDSMVDSLKADFKADPSFGIAPSTIVPDRAILARWLLTIL
jgi:hypothetical protein